MSRLVWALCAALLLVGCYDPAIPDCVLPCESDSQCPSGKQCGELLVCAAAAAVEHCGRIDASTEPGSNIDATVDTRPDASQAACEAVCQGPGRGCIDGECTIVCPKNGCTERVKCPKGVPCHVECAGKACAGGVDCTQASTCVIECDGNMSCAGTVTCGSGSCTVQCQGPNSCASGAQCGDSCACSVGCRDGLCVDATTCRQGCESTGNQCRADKGCNSCQ